VVANENAIKWQPTNGKNDYAKIATRKKFDKLFSWSWNNTMLGDESKRGFFAWKPNAMEAGFPGIFQFR